MLSEPSIRMYTAFFALIFLASACAPQPFTPSATACEALIGDKFLGDPSAGVAGSSAAPGYGASPSSASSDREQKTAQKLTTKGINKYNDGDFRGAIRALADSYDRRPSKDNTLYSARAFRQLECGNEARRLYRVAVTVFSGSIQAEERAEAQGFLNPPPPPPSKEELASAKKEADEKAAREDAERAEAKRREQEERDKHNQACEAVRSHTDRGDLALLRDKAQACPEAVTDTQKGWLAEYQKSLEMTAKYEKALSGTSSDMERFYYNYYDTGDPRVEEIRKLAEKKFGPSNVRQYRNMQRSVANTSTRSFRVSLCDISEGTAKVEVAPSNEMGAGVGLSLLLGGNRNAIVDAIKDLQKAQEITRKNALRITGAKQAEIYSSCVSPHWYISDRPWPPKKANTK